MFHFLLFVFCETVTNNALTHHPTQPPHRRVCSEALLKIVKTWQKDLLSRFVNFVWTKSWMCHFSHVFAHFLALLSTFACIWQRCLATESLLILHTPTSLMLVLKTSVDTESNYVGSMYYIIGHRYYAVKMYCTYLLNANCCSPFVPIISNSELK